MRRIVELATEPGELVVDLFAGSGTTAVAARGLGPHLTRLSPGAGLGLSRWRW